MRPNPPSPLQSNWSGVQREMAVGAAALLVLGAWVTWVQQLSSMAEDLNVLLLACALAAVCLWVALRGRRHPTAAGLVLVACAAVGAAVPLLALGYAYAAPFLALPVVLAAFLLGPAAAVALAGAAALAVRVAPALPAAARWPDAFLVLTLAALSAWLVRCMRRPLWQAWRTTEDVSALTRELRLRQQEVNKLNKALTAANGLLRHSLHELSMAQKEALEARRLKEEFATTVSHELRTPLNTILGFLEMMERYPEVYGQVTWTPELRRDIGEMQSSARYLSELVDDILDLARIQALKMPMRREPTDLPRLIREVADLAARLLLGREQVRLELDLPARLPVLQVDPTRIEQVLLNLVANACRFTDAGSITIAARAEADEVVVSVSDTGSGMPQADLERVFDAFTQSSAPQSERLFGGGKGLGLAIARRLISMHGGRIWAESQLGVGSTFSFSLPLAPIQVVPLPPPVYHAAGASGAPARCVVLVDGPEGTRFLSRHLEGLEVVPAASLAEACAVAYRCHPSAVLVNAAAGTVAGPLEAAAGSGAPVPVIYCSLPVGGHAAEAEPFDDWLVKPVTGERLAAALAASPAARRVLVVDDDVPFAHLIQRLIEVQGGHHEVVVAHDGRSALRLAESVAPDLVFLDVALPDTNGRSVARALRRLPALARARLVAVTALQPGVEGASGLPQTFVVESPLGFSEEETLALIHSCLEHLKPAYLPASLA